MIGGFTFDGVDIADIGLEYTPDNQNTYVYKTGAYKIHEQIFDGHDGGYYYGNTTQPKSFVLRCIYEDQHVLDGVIAKTDNLFRRGRTGKLVFKKRPWCWYVATVTNIDFNQMTNYQNGVVTITMKAYYPYARTDYKNIPDDCEYEKDMLNNSALLKEEVANAELIEVPVTGYTEILIHNPGTEKAKTAIRIAGDVGHGVTITNATSKQSCRFVGITNEVCAGNYYIQCDGLNGQTTVTNGIISKPGFLYHDYGFIDLEPGYPAYRDVNVTVNDNRNITSNDEFKDDMLGRYIYFANGAIAQIERIDSAGSLQVGQTTDGTALDANASGKAQILNVNKIIIHPDDNINLTKLDILFKPTFA